MARGNTFGHSFCVTTFGESHGEALGVVIDGMPGNYQVNLEDLQKELDRRAPGRVPGTTSRKERDKVEILSGVFEGKTLGTPIAALVRNENQKSEDYEKWKDDYRPGHADKSTQLKYGIRDYRGGGRSSGRETLCRVIAGYFAGLLLPHVQVRGFLKSLAHFECSLNSLSELPQTLGSYCFGNPEREPEVEDFLVAAKEEGNSYGGKAGFFITGVPTGLGEPVFDKLKADFAKAVMSVGAVVGFSFGASEDFTKLDGKTLSTDASHFGGMEGGISNGEDIYLEVWFKPPSTVGKKAMEGRHDPCVIPRAIPVIEAMLKMTLADHFLRQKTYG